MAIYHCSIKIVSRGKGKSAVAAAAYRSGDLIKNEYDGIIHDYTRKGGVVHTEIMLPEHAPEEYTDRAILWNAVEKIEKAKNSQLAREIELALPVELTQEQNISLARDYISRHFVSAGMCADICIHDKNDGNPHAHVMLTMRPFEQDGTWGAKSRKEYVLDNNGERVKLKNGNFKTCKVDLMNWNEPTKAEEWRAAWAQSVNAVLEKQNIPERVDHRSYERQGIEQVPTVHMGVATTQMEKRGIITERGNMNRVIASINQKMRQLWNMIVALKDRLKETITPTAYKDEKPSIMAQLNKYKMEAKHMESLTEPPAPAELRIRFNLALENLKQIDARLKFANGAAEYDKILPERHKAYVEYSTLKSEVKKAEASLQNKKSRSRDWER